MFGLWCNGSTTGFGSVCPGSNPGSPTERNSGVDSITGVFFVLGKKKVPLSSCSLLGKGTCLIVGGVSYICQSFDPLKVVIDPFPFKKLIVMFCPNITIVIL